MSRFVTPCTERESERARVSKGGRHLKPWVCVCVCGGSEQQVAQQQEWHSSRSGGGFAAAKDLAAGVDAVGVNGGWSRCGGVSAIGPLAAPAEVQK